MAKVVFSIDHYHQLHNLAKFLRHMDTKRAEGKLRGKFSILQGSWQGVPELSFECEAEDYADFVIPYGVMKDQQATLLVYPSGIVFEVSKNNASRYLGVWTEVSQLETKMAEGYTYNPEENKWYLIK